ncbi:Uncharacterised protein [Klebsiella pneumoniae]|uniref:Uncharacterized protein n=1 Tax=Klebsiella pneumoniae TaxID=573 RepID=A0A377WSW7_KLEPN|nr:Uncharacterised protein [Klebsiella pneumoniae]
MEPKPNWLVRHINLITTAVALYPWLLMILLLWDNQRHHQHGYAALGAAIAILFLLALTSGMNLLISSLVIFCARCSTPPLAGGAAVRFFRHELDLGALAYPSVLQLLIFPPARATAAAFSIARTRRLRGLRARRKSPPGRCAVRCASQWPGRAPARRHRATTAVSRG